MSQSAVPISPSSPNDVFDDTDPTSVHAKLRYSKRQPDQSQPQLGTPAYQHNLDHAQTCAVESSQLVESAPARMTRKRAAHLANLEDAALYKSVTDISNHTIEETESPEAFVSQICLCQPDPKIPRPRNGQFSASLAFDMSVLRG